MFYKHFSQLLSSYILFLFCTTLFAQNTIVDTCGTNGNLNNLLGKWYVYDDNPKKPCLYGIWIDSIGFLDSLAGGNSIITNFSKINIKDYEEFSMTPGGNPDGTVGYCAKITFQFGDTLPHWGLKEDEVYGCFTGMKTNLSPADTVKDLTGATKISYWAKASDAIYAEFIVETKQGTFDFFDTFYRIRHLITPEWQEYFVYLREKDSLNPDDSMYLYQPAWAIDDIANLILPWETEQHGILPFDISKVTKMRWELAGAGEAGHKNKDWYMMPGSLWVDDIIIHDYAWNYHILTAHPGTGTCFKDSLTITFISSSSFIFYTTNGSEPDTTNPAQLYTAPFTIYNDTVVVKATATGGNLLPVCKLWVYYKSSKYAPLVASPVNGTPFINSLVISLFTDSGCTINYTTDGTEPTKASPVYTGPFTIFAAGNVFDTVVVKALATSKHYLDTRKTWTYYSIATAIQSNSLFHGEHLSMVIQPNANKTLRFLIGIPYKNSQTAHLALYTLAGRKLVEQIITGYGYHKISFTHSVLSRGVYICKLTNGKNRIMRRILFR